MPEKKTDSKDGLGNSIADAFDDDGEENTDGEKEDNAGGDNKTGSRDTGNEDSQEDKTGKDDKTGDKEEDDEDEKTVTLTESKLREIVGSAVNEAVAKTNSTKDKALEKQRRGSREEQERLVREREDAQLNGLSDEDKTRMREVHKNDRRERELDEKEEEAADIFRAAKVAQHSASHARFGVTEAELEDCESEAEMVALCTGKERDYWQTFAETGKAPDGSAGKKGTDKRKKPAGSARKTDTGGDGAGGESGGDKEPATNLNSFAKGLVDNGVVPSRGIKIGDGK